MTKIWIAAFWKPRPAGPGVPIAAPSRRDLTVLAVPVVAMASVTVIIGVWAEPFVEIATLAAADLLDPAAYVSAVLGGGS
jgi:multicomponent Na+:H+ antiporter subunit D